MFLQVKDLQKSFRTDFWKPRHQVLKGLSFEVHEGRATGFIGVNGAGKTTTLKCSLGFVRPDAGEILFFGEKLSREVKAKLGYLPERPYFYEFLTAREFLEFHWRLSGQKGSPSLAEVEKLLGAVGLKQAMDRKLKSFSKGMLQRVGLAQALLANPPAIILDEPMSGLDPDGRLMMKDLLKSWRKQGKTLFFSSHLLNDMEDICDDLVVIEQGKLLYQGSVQGFKTRATVEESFRDWLKS